MVEGTRGRRGEVGRGEWKGWKRGGRYVGGRKGGRREKGEVIT